MKWGLDLINNSRSIEGPIGERENSSVRASGVKSVREGVGLDSCVKCNRELTWVLRNGKSGNWKLVHELGLGLVFECSTEVWVAMGA